MITKSQNKQNAKHQYERKINTSITFAVFIISIIITSYTLIFLYDSETNLTKIRINQFENRVKRISFNIDFILSLTQKDTKLLSENAHIINYAKLFNEKYSNNIITHSEISPSLKPAINLLEEISIQNKLIYSYEIYDNKKNKILFISNNKNQIIGSTYINHETLEIYNNDNKTKELLECETTSSTPTIAISRPIISNGQIVGSFRVRIIASILLRRFFNNEQEELQELIFLQHDNCRKLSSTIGNYDLPDFFSVIQSTATRINTPRYLDKRLSNWSDESIAVIAPINNSGFSIIAIIPAESIFNSKTMPVAFLAAVLSILLLAGFGLAIRLNTTRAFLRAQLEEKEKSEAQLRKHMDEFNTLFNALPGYAWQKDIDGRLVTANAATCRFLEQPLENLIGKKAHDIFPSDLADAFRHFVAPLLSGKQRFIEEERELVWQGKVLDFSTRAESILADDGTVCGIIGLSMDITQKRLTEKKLKRHSALQKTILDLAITLVNHPATEMDEAIQNALGMIGAFCDADRAYVFRYDYSMEHAINTHEWRIHDTSTSSDLRRKLSKSTLEALARFHRADKEVYIPSTESLTLDSAIQTSLRRQGIHAFISIPIIHDSQCTGFVGYESMRKDKIWEEEEINLLKIASQLLTNAEMRRVHELRLIEARSIAEEAYDVMEKTIQDRTLQLTLANQRLNSEIYLRIQAIQNLQITLKAISAILIAIDNDNFIAQWSHAAERSFGLQYSQAIGKKFQHQPIPWNWDVIDRAIQECRAEKSATKVSNVKFIHANGSDRFLVVTVTPLLDDVGAMTGCLLLGEDITEIKTLEAQLAQAARLEGLGQLAAGIAHEINTPIQYVGDSLTFLNESYQNLDKILAFATTKCGQRIHNFDIPCHLNMLLKEADIDFIREEVPKTFTRIEQGLEKISSIVRAMNRFSPCDISDKTMSDINEIVENAITITQNVWKYSADVKVHLEDGKLLIPCMHGEIGQTLINIIINAAHAIEDVVKGTKVKGLIYITTKKKEKYLEIRIKDTGPGIPPDIANKVFNMFFTTKPIGRGTGQGLALAHHTIVTRHKGTLTYETTPGQGTTFIITLPFDLNTMTPE
ncbi:MAG: PAS domain S-box protein [Desulfomicrobium sp.]